MKAFTIIDLAYGNAPPAVPLNSAAAVLGKSLADAAALSLRVGQRTPRRILALALESLETRVAEASMPLAAVPAITHAAARQAQRIGERQHEGARRGRTNHSLGRRELA